MTLDEYIEQCKELSLTARLAVALIVFQRYCSANGLQSPAITAFCDYLWKWPLVYAAGADQFTPWERARTELVEVGLGNPLGAELQALLAARNIDEGAFREVVQGVVEILWGSFWGAADGPFSLRMLRNVIERSGVVEMPVLAPFRNSRFQDGGGWGERMLPADLALWREHA